MRWHLIDADDALGELPGETRLLPEWEFLQRPRDQGREAAQRWWGEHGPAVGRASSVDALRRFGGEAPAQVPSSRLNKVIGLVSV